MQRLSDLADKALQSTTTTPTGETEQDRKVVNYLFKRLMGLFPAWQSTFKDQAQVDAAKREWMSALIDHGINTEDQLKAGIRQAQLSTSPFWPSVGQFISWCQVQPDWESQSHLMLEDRTTQAITKEERVAKWEEHAGDLAKALKGKLDE